MFGKTAVVALALAALPFSLAQISDGFEDGWNQAVWPIYAPDCNQGGTVSLDTTVAHTGKNSMKVTSPGGYCGHIFFGNVASIPAGNVYVRTWILATNLLTSNHVSFIVMTDPNLGSDEHLRIGGQDQILMYNRQSDDATLPDMSPQGVATSEPLPAGSWQCFEYHVSSSGLIETWLNGAAIAGMTVGPGVTNPDANGWGSSYKPDITGVYFGWESYGGDANTFWYDDVAIAASRVGCGSGSTTAPPSTSISSSTKTTKTPTSAPPTSTVPTTTSMSTTFKTSTTMTTSSAQPSSGTVPEYGQCGGIGWSGGTACVAPYTCKVSNPYYSQCL